MHGGLKPRDGKGCTAHHAGPVQKMQRALAIRWHRTLGGGEVVKSPRGACPGWVLR